MRLLIAARASVARAIMMALPHDYTREEGYYQIQKSQIQKSQIQKSHNKRDDSIDRITWCGGHLLEWAAPEEYDPEYHSWRLEHLPILPTHSALRGWKTVERASTRAQLEVIQQLILQADEIIHAGDPDREGQWMIDEVLAYVARQQPEKKIFTHTLAVKRLLVDDLNPQCIRDALQELHDNREFKTISESARARSQADWLYGINMTRAYTLLGRHAGYEGVLSVGRVQTPVLGLVVKRDEAIEQFRAEAYAEVQAKFIHQPAGITSLALHARQMDKTQADVLAERFVEKSGEVIDRQDIEAVLPPPLPFDLSTLQIECASQFGYSAREVMDACQQMYEKYHLISYPRTDSRYLPEKHFEKASEILDTIGRVSQKTHDGLMEKIRQTDCWIKHAAWNDEKSKLHHAIVPALRVHDAPELTEIEQNIYNLVARYYIAQFYPDYHETRSLVRFEVAGELFSVHGLKVLRSGWREVIPTDKNPEEDLLNELPAWKKGDRVFCADVMVREKKTRPPARFTDASLMKAISHIAPYVQDEAIRKDLQEHDGLGTEATRALVIEGLFKRGFLMKGNKNIFSAPIGRDLVHALPPAAVSVDMTAQWEKNLSRIADGSSDVDRFMEVLEAQLTDLVQQARQKKVMTVTSADEVLGLQHKEKFHCPRCHSLLVHRQGKHGAFWGCSSYPDCKTTLPDHVDAQGNSAPDFVAFEGGARMQRPALPSLGKNCPDCGKPLVKRKGKRGAFAGCSGFPECRHTEPLLKDRDDVD